VPCAPLMRATVHLVSARDCLSLRPLTQVVLERSFAGQQFARNLAGIDLDDVREAGRLLLQKRPRTRRELGQLLAIKWPDSDPASLAYAVSYVVATVQVPPRGVWRTTGPATLAPAESWSQSRSTPTHRWTSWSSAISPDTVPPASTTSSDGPV
jgi:hypothetical protein